MKLSLRDRLRIAWQFGWLKPVTGAAVAGLVLAGAAIWMAPEPHQHLRLEIAQVVSSVAIQSEMGARIQYLSKLADGSQHAASTRSGWLTGQIGEAGCVEVRRAIESGRLRVLSVPAAKCD
ncbi:MAG: hypothetical protein GY717_14255 [Rhodobacteraceae bacterium]|nr:hypothetical protein [Paracoccaceae bacterium]